MTEHIELCRRVWPKGMPGRCDIGRFNDLDNLTSKDVGEMQISYFVGSVPTLGLSNAHHDPAFQDFDPSNDEGLTKQQINRKRQWFRLVKQMNAIREQYPFIPGGNIDFDSLVSDNGAVPAFVRSEGDEAIIILGNLSSKTKKVSLHLTDFGKENLPMEADTLALKDIIRDNELKTTVQELMNGKMFRLKSGEVRAWYIS